MVKHITLDCARLLDRAGAHTYLAEALSLPDYYGRNLDALYDCLGDLGPTEITLERFELLREAGGYAEMILNVILEAAEGNPYLTVGLSTPGTADRGAARKKSP